jgi:Flagellar hook-length control protein FliK
VITAHATAAQHNANKQALMNATASASNSAASQPSMFSSVLSALGLGDDSATSPAIPSAGTQTVTNPGTKNPSGSSVLTARNQKLLAQKGLKSLKVLTPAEAAQLASQSQNQQVPAAQMSLAASLASTPPSSSSGFSIGSTISSVESAIKGGIAGVLDAVGGISSSTSDSTPAVPPLAAPVVAGGGNVSASKAQAQSAANTATSANSEALEVTLAQAMGVNTAQNPDEADAAMDASALDGARITAAKNPSADQIAASKQQAFANLKPASDVKATETQALAPDAGTAKADSKDAGTKSDDSNNGGNSQDQAASGAAPGTQPVNPQQAAPQQQPNVSFAAQVADNIAANTAAAANMAPNHSGIAAPATSITVAPSTDPSAATKLDTSSLAVSIAAKSVEGAKLFDIRLDPPELGRVDVKLSVDATGKAQAHLSVEKPQTLDMLQQDSGSLQRSLKESGVDLANNGLQFSLKNQQQSASTPTPMSRARALQISAAPVAASTSTTDFAHGHARLDIRV